MRAVFAVFVVPPFLLAVCGGATTRNVAAYKKIIASQTNPLAAEIRTNAANALTSTPVESSVTMSGTFELARVVAHPTFDGVTGQIDMTANLASGTVSGRIYDIGATATGSATDPDGVDYNVSANLNGDIYRRSGGALAAASGMTATATGVGGSTSYSGVYRVTE